MIRESNHDNPYHSLSILKVPWKLKEITLEGIGEKEGKKSGNTLFLMVNLIEVLRCHLE